MSTGFSIRFYICKTGNAPRYDRLIQYRNGKLRFAEWYYGPMIWRYAQPQILHAKKINCMMKPAQCCLPGL